ncbi:MAG: amidohydrolase family protein [Clostridia bacterium]|nr:amidohydrolase family protein [Clostridia bacterium]
MIKAIVNTNLILEEGIIFSGAIVWKNGRILSLGKADEVEIPACAEIIDAQGRYTAPGLVDIHNHGGPDFLFWEDPNACCEFFLTHGQTTVLPTFYCDMTEEKLLLGLDRVKAASKEGAGRIIGGIYMEGPYMNGVGSNQKNILWGGDIVPEEYGRVLAAMAGYAKIWAMDPGRPGIEGFMAAVKAADPNAIFTMGHSRSTAADCRKVKKYGVKLQTHHGDSGKCPGRAQGTIGAGCDEFALLDPDIYTELICDENGIHVDADMMKMLIHTKGIERVILITDHMADKNHYTNNEADGILYGPDLNYDYEGHLAGSHLTLENACRNLMAHTGYGLCHAVRMATINPARVLGIDGEVGSLEVGKKANLIITDDRFNIETVILEGDVAVQNGNRV